MKPKQPSEEILREWQELLDNARPPQWILDMIAFYRRTGKYRYADVHRLFGDPNRGTSGDPQEFLAWLLEAEQQRKQEKAKEAEPS